MAKVIDPAKAASRWTAGFSSPQAQQAYKDGVNHVQESPTAAAARSLDRYQAGVMDAVSSGRMAAALQKVTADQWKQACITTGAARMATGAQKGAAKYAAFAQRAASTWQQIRDQVKSMPKGGAANAQARWLISYQAMKQLAGKPTT